MEDMLVEDEVGFAAKDLILTTEEFNKISAAMTPEHGGQGENQDVVIRKELLHMLINWLEENWPGVQWKRCYGAQEIQVRDTGVQRESGFFRRFSSSQCCTFQE